MLSLFGCVFFFVDGYRYRLEGKEDHESFSSSTSRFAGKSVSAIQKTLRGRNHNLKFSIQRPSPSTLSNSIILFTLFFYCMERVPLLMMSGEQLKWARSRNFRLFQHSDQMVLELTKISK